MPFFTIIVPVYNVENYIEACLTSILRQGFKDWECLCVDDGSTDSSLMILKTFSNKDDRIRVMHQDNAGVSVARNTGLNAANGKFVIFVDGDDIVTPWALEMLHKVICELKVDAVVTSPVWKRFISETDSKEIIGESNARYEAGRLESRTVSNRYKLLCGKDAVTGGVTGRAFSRLMFGAFRFTAKVAIMEDLRLFVDMLELPAKWAIVNMPFYLYRDRPGSAVHGAPDSFLSDVIAAYNYVLPILSGKPEVTKGMLQEYWLSQRKFFWYVWRKILHDWHKLSNTQRRIYLEEYQACFDNDVIAPICSYRIVRWAYSKNVDVAISRIVYLCSRVSSGIVSRVERLCG